MSDKFTHGHLACTAPTARRGTEKMNRRKREEGWRSNIRAGLLACTTVAALVLAGCNGGGGSGGGGGYSDPYWHAWYNVNGYLCISAGYPQPGCNFYWDGSTYRKIQESGDPYYYDYYSPQFFHDKYYEDSWGNPRWYTGYGWESPNGILYDEWGYALNNTGRTRGRDLTADIIEQKEAKYAEAAQALSERYSNNGQVLSEETSLHIVRTLGEYAEIGRSRTRTAQDMADFSKRLFGIEAGQVANAIALAQKGDMSGINQVKDQVSTFWGTNPEVTEAVARDWFASQIEEFERGR